MKDQFKKEHKFKGVSVESGEWVYGQYAEILTDDSIDETNIKMYLRYPVSKTLKPYIIVTDGLSQELIQIHPESLSAYIGCVNHDGIELYQGDLVETMSEGYKGRFVIKWRQEATPCYILYPAWQNRESWSISCSWDDDMCEYVDRLEVVGHAYTDRELLKEIVEQGKVK